MPTEKDIRSMKAQTIRAKLDRINDAKSAERRFRNILANSGEVMESGERRPLEDLYVMDYDGNLIRIAELAKNPDEQTEEYSVKAQADHGELIDGQLVPSIEKQFGNCRVWLEEDGLHARMYFANNDSLADHAWAISDGASYSIGFDWFPEGYYGTGYQIDQAIGILREISMVLTGNDPRAKTIDHAPTEAEAQRGAEVANGNQSTERNDDVKDTLTGDESVELKRVIAEAIDEAVAKYTEEPAAAEESTEAEADDAEPEGAEPTTEEAPEAEPAAEESAEAEAEEDSEEESDEPKAETDMLHMPVTTIKDKATNQETITMTDWRFSAEAKSRFADLAGKYGKFDASFKNAWANELAAHKATMTDGVTGLALPVDLNTLFIDAINEGTSDSAKILSHFRNLGGNGYLINLLQEATAGETARAHGFKKGDAKINQELKNNPRTVYNKMVYKKLDLDALEVKENPQLVEIRAAELIRSIMAEIARAAIIGDGRTAPSGNDPDYRMFDGTRGFYSMAADAADKSGVGAAFATEITLDAGKNLYDASVEAESEIEAEGGLIYVAKKSAVKALRQAQTSTGGYLVQPGASIEAVLNAKAIYTPSWMKDSAADVIVFAEGSYGLTGEAQPTIYTDFDLNTNKNVVLAEAPRGGSLIAGKAAAAIKFGE